MSHAEAPIRIGHYHFNVISAEAHKKFWADTLGGRAMKFGGIDVIEFPDAFIFLRALCKALEAKWHKGKGLDKIN